MPTQRGIFCTPGSTGSTVHGRIRKGLRDKPLSRLNMRVSGPGSYTFLVHWDALLWPLLIIFEMTHTVASTVIKVNEYFSSF